MFGLCSSPERNLHVTFLLPLRVRFRIGLPGPFHNIALVYNFTPYPSSFSTQSSLQFNQVQMTEMTELREIPVSQSGSQDVLPVHNHEEPSREGTISDPVVISRTQTVLSIYQEMTGLRVHPLGESGSQNVLPD